MKKKKLKAQKDACIYDKHVFVKKDTRSLCCYTHMTVQDDGPYQAQNDGRFPFYDVWDVYVHQLDL